MSINKVNIKQLTELIKAEDTHFLPCEAGCPNLGTYVYKEKFYCYPHILALRQKVS